MRCNTSKEGPTLTYMFGEIPTLIVTTNRVIYVFKVTWFAFILTVSNCVVHFGEMEAAWPVVRKLPILFTSGAIIIVGLR